jgi:hypothetical protein
MVVRSVPTVFMKLTSSPDPDTDVLLPPEAIRPDYEAELASVIAGLAITSLSKTGSNMILTPWISGRHSRANSCNLQMRWLQPDEEMIDSIEDKGTLRNRIRAIA